MASGLLAIANHISIMRWDLNEVDQSLNFRDMHSLPLHIPTFKRTSIAGMQVQHHPAKFSIRVGRYGMVWYVGASSCFYSIYTVASSPYPFLAIFKKWKRHRGTKAHGEGGRQQIWFYTTKKLLYICSTSNELPPSTSSKLKIKTILAGVWEKQDEITIVWSATQHSQLGWSPSLTDSKSVSTCSN